MKKQVKPVKAAAKVEAVASAPVDLYPQTAAILTKNPDTPINVLAGKLKTNIGTANLLMRQFRSGQVAEVIERERPKSAPTATQREVATQYKNLLRKGLDTSNAPKDVQDAHLAVHQNAQSVHYHDVQARKAERKANNTAVVAAMTPSTDKQITKAKNEMAAMVPAVPDRPIHRTLISAGFLYKETKTTEQDIAHGYTHTDGRAAIYAHTKRGTRERWTVGSRGGKDEGTDIAELNALLQMAAGEKALAKAIGMVEPPEPTAGSEELLPHAFVRGPQNSCTVCHREESDGPHVVEERALSESTLAEDIARENAELAAALRMPATINGMPAHVARAIEMLGSATVWKFDMDAMKSAKMEKRRKVILDKLTGERALSASHKDFELALYGAMGVLSMAKVDRPKEFAARCKKLAAAFAKVKAKLKKTATIIESKARSAAAPQLPGNVLPSYDKPTKSERRAMDKQTAYDVAALAELTADMGPVARPRPDAHVNICPEELELLVDPRNKLVMLRLECQNSQGAICVYNNGQRVAAGVVSTETLARLKPAAVAEGSSKAATILAVANTLLEPTLPGVTVTTVARRHLQAVTELQEMDIVTAENKKFAKSKGAKATAKKAATTKKAKSTEPTERKTSLFRLNKATEKEWGAFTGQKGEIVAAFKKLGAVGAKAAGVTRAALIAALPKIGPNNISFYLSKWQEPKFVEKHASE